MAVLLNALRLASFLLAAVCAAVLSGLNGLVEDAQVAGAPAGDVESIAAGFVSPSEAARNTDALMRTWTGPGLRELTSVVMRVYLAVDSAYIVSYVALIVLMWIWLGAQELPANVPQSPLRSLTLSSWWWKAAPIVLLAGAGVVENVQRYRIFQWYLTTPDTSGPSVLLSYCATILKFVALGFLLAVAAESAWRNRGRWFGPTVKALGRVRIPAVLVLVVVVLLVGDRPRSRRVRGRPRGDLPGGSGSSPFRGDGVAVAGGTAGVGRGAVE